MGLVRVAELVLGTARLNEGQVEHVPRTHGGPQEDSLEELALEHRWLPLLDVLNENPEVLHQRLLVKTDLPDVDFDVGALIVPELDLAPDGLRQ